MLALSYCLLFSVDALMLSLGILPFCFLFLVNALVLSLGLLPFGYFLLVNASVLGLFFFFNALSFGLGSLLIGDSLLFLNSSTLSLGLFLKA